MVEFPPLKKVTSGKVTSLVVLVGFEPTQTEPESGVLPLHHRTIPKCDAKVLLFSELARVSQVFFQKKLIFPSFSAILTTFDGKKRMWRSLSAVTREEGRWLWHHDFRPSAGRCRDLRGWA